MSWDGKLMHVNRRLFDGEAVGVEEIGGLLPVMRGQAGSPNHKLEGAACWYAWTMTALRAGGKSSVTRAHLLDLLDFELDVGIFAVRGSKKNQGAPVSEAIPTSHAAHHVRALAMATWAAWKANDAEVLDRCRQLWRQFLLLGWISSWPSPEGLRWYAVGPRAFDPGKGKKPAGPKAKPRQGTSLVLNELLRLVFEPEKANPRMWTPRKGNPAADLLGLRVVNALLGEGFDFGLGHAAAVSAAVTPLQVPAEVITDADLPRTVDPMTIYRSEAGVLVVLGSNTNWTTPGPFWWAQSPIGTLGEQFGVEPAIADAEKGFFDLPAPSLRSAFATWRTRGPKEGSVMEPRTAADAELAALRGEAAEWKDRADRAEREVTRLQVAEGAAEEEIRGKDAALALAGEALEAVEPALESLRGDLAEHQYCRSRNDYEICSWCGVYRGSPHATTCTPPDQERHVKELREVVATALSSAVLALAVAQDRARREVVLLGAEVERVYLNDNCTCEHETGYRCTGCRFATALQDVRRLEAQPGKKTR